MSVYLLLTTFLSSFCLFSTSLLSQETTLAQSSVPRQVRIDQLKSQGFQTVNAPMSQIPSVFQLRDVQPSEWAFEALRSLVERYGCIVGYPDQTFRGDRAVTRWEFAAGLNACLNTIERLLRENVAVSQEDIDKLKRLAVEFQSELAALGTRADNLESRVAYLEDHQFSTTTKLYGQAIFALGGAFGGNQAVSGRPVLPALPGESGDAGDNTTPVTKDISNNVFLSDRVRLVLDTSFNGKDLLRMRMQAGNTPDLAETTGTRMARLSFTSPTDNDVVINKLEYRFPIGDKGMVFVEAFGFLDLFAPTLHPLDGDYDTVLTGFSLRSPIYFQSGLTGIGVHYNFTDFFSFSGGYLAGDATAGNPETGPFNGSYGALAQLTFYPTDELAFAFTYLNGYDNGTGNAPAGGFFGSENATFPFGFVPTSYNSYGIEAQYEFSPNFLLSGWVGWTKATNESQENKGADADLFYWAATLSFPDLWQEGNLGGIIVGQPSTVTSNELRDFQDPDSAIMIETFYRYMINNHIGVTPGFVVIFNPESNSANNTIYLGVIRTHFKF